MLHNKLSKETRNKKGSKLVAQRGWDDGMGQEGIETRTHILLLRGGEGGGRGRMYQRSTGTTAKSKGFLSQRASETEEKRGCSKKLAEGVCGGERVWRRSGLGLLESEEVQDGDLEGLHDGERAVEPCYWRTRQRTGIWQLS
ncbi:hypothetical protein AJ79_02635 [Helicocarpus griseus UAMH5409]|uniref:Uncharacterized protein n=1 Tax=Helicocarpus griseus UAMH5409 TaxID=1447875 RepID=A0A2B7Y1U8_9EURO|nr:hypothetical protein AJ79_02635 [Helicocarpus griseus UAMH5409]